MWASFGSNTLCAGLLYIVADAQAPLVKEHGMLQFFNVRKRRLPAVLIADASDINKKHKLEGKVNAESMMQFAADFFGKKLKTFKLNQDPVDDSNSTVKTLVNGNWAERVELSGQNHVVIFGSGFGEQSSSCVECVAMPFKLNHIAENLLKPEDKTVPHLFMRQLIYLLQHSDLCVCHAVSCCLLPAAATHQHEDASHI
jgi:hypothetical protein